MPDTCYWKDEYTFVDAEHEEPVGLKIGSSACDKVEKTDMWPFGMHKGQGESCSAAVHQPEESTFCFRADKYYRIRKYGDAHPGSGWN